MTLGTFYVIVMALLFIYALSFTVGATFFTENDGDRQIRICRVECNDE